MDNWENKTFNGIHATRFIMSWIRSGGQLSHLRDLWNFNVWLKSIGLTDGEAHYIFILASEGKLELENSAKDFLSKLENN